ncbi:Gpr107 [Symbiodinium natans]|uniref:Gpr107 protein n=1 Tax=Symbiodinium natans TaxID=878477 RepID=A0A812PHP5_9DINO|nr:Gpr107 [Symbiodinium natans]
MPLPAVVSSSNTASHNLQYQHQWHPRYNWAGMAKVWCLAYLCMYSADAVQVQVNFQMSNNIASWLVSDFGLDVGGHIAMDLTNSQPANDTYVLILTRSQLLEWRDADADLAILVPLSEKAPRPLNSFLVSAYRANLREHLRGYFRAEEATGGRDRYNIVIMSATKSPLAIRGTLTLENPNGQQLSVQVGAVTSRKAELLTRCGMLSCFWQDVEVPKTLLVAGNVYFAAAPHLSDSFVWGTCYSQVSSFILCESSTR